MTKLITARTKTMRIHIVTLIMLVILITMMGFAHADKCSSGQVVYGQNEIIDQLIICSLAKGNDLDLTPSGGNVKQTARTFTELGFGNKTEIVSSKLSGLWTAKRAEFAETNWRCNSDGTIVASAIIEINGLALDLIEKVDISLSRRAQLHTKVSNYKPCKMFNLPPSLCRQTKTIYRNTRTWVNKAYFNLTLTQKHNEKTIKPVIQDLWLMFTCPENFRHKITYSPSASYILSHFSLNYIEQQDSSSARSMNMLPPSKKRTLQLEQNIDTHVPIPSPIAQVSVHDGKGLIAPPYLASVDLILRTTGDALRKTISQCINKVDSDLNQVADHSSFSNIKYPAMFSSNGNREYGTQLVGAPRPTSKLTARCSNKQWLEQRAEIALKSVSELNEDSNSFPSQSNGNVKRNQIHQILQKASQDELLDPYGYYHDENMVVNDSNKNL